MITFIGPNAKFTSHGYTFVRGEKRPIPDDVAAALAGHPWFEVDLPAPVAPVAAVAPVVIAEPKRRGRPRKADGN